MRLTLALTLALSLVPTGALAQTYAVAPSGFGYGQRPGEAGVGTLFSGGAVVREMQLFDNAHLGFASATIVDLAWRRDAGGETYGAFAVNLTVRMGYSAQDPDTMGFEFASIPSAPMTTVFQGPVSLPRAVGGAGPHPWAVVVALAQPFVFQASQGNLLLELVSQQTGLVVWRRDARAFYDGTPGSWAVTAAPCANANGFSMTHRPTVLENCAPGRRMQLWLAGAPPFDPDVFHVLGVVRPTPLSLAPYGAPGCALGVLPWLLVRQVMTSVATTSFSYAYVDYPLPSDPGLIGAKLGSQWFNQDTPAGNTLGVVLSDAIEITLGAPPSRRYATQRLVGFSATAALGTQAAGELGAIVRFGL